ncbi:MAG TPA: hypothetical protein VGM15_03130 [Burkholderiaceae bacterium]|jgi:hypothetical protein
MTDDLAPALELAAAPVVAEMAAEASRLSIEARVLAASVEDWTHEEANECSLKVSSWKLFLLGLDERRKEITRPLDAAKKSVMALFRPAEEETKSAIAVLGDAVRVFLARQRERALEAERAAHAQAKAQAQALQAQAAQVRAAGDPDTARALETAAAILPASAAAQVPAAATRLEGLAERDAGFGYEVNEAELPREYLTADHVKIRAVVKAFGAETNIPGVTVFPKTSTLARK